MKTFNLLLVSVFLLFDILRYVHCNLEAVYAASDDSSSQVHIIMCCRVYTMKWY